MVIKEFPEKPEETAEGEDSEANSLSELTLLYNLIHERNETKTGRV